MKNVEYYIWYRYSKKKKMYYSNIIKKNCFIKVIKLKYVFITILWYTNVKFSFLGENHCKH